MSRLACFIAVVVLLAACSPIDRTYGSIQEARAANVFERDLPDILPASTKNILVRHKWGSSGESGAFFFDPRERASFSAKLSESINPHVWSGDFAKTIPTFGLVGVHPLVYDSPEGHWVFFCADGNACTTCTWMKR